MENIFRRSFVMHKYAALLRQRLVFGPLGLLRHCLVVSAAILLGGAMLVAPAAAQTTAPKVKFQTTMGDFVIEVYPDKAPKTVENFLQYVKDKHYDGTIFHRVIPTFMVQGGGFDAQYAEKKTRPPVVHEGRDAIAKGGSKNVIGTVAMARTNDPQSATAQFFINVQDNSFLDPTQIPPGDPVPVFKYQGIVYKDTPRERLVNAPQLFGYTVFGKVVSGMDVITKMKATPTGAGGPFPTDVPQTPILINSATLLK
jgi:peptidyl-prolyl cis-trans isomerase A (cyclophilin A)